MPCVQCEAAPGFLSFGLLVQALFGVCFACASVVLEGTCRYLVCGSLRLRGGSGVLYLCASKSQCVVALLKLLVLRVFLLVWVSGGESLSVGLESF